MSATEEVAAAPAPATEAPQTEESAAAAAASRGEKKARKILTRAVPNLEELKGITKVEFRSAKSAPIIVNNPTVLTIPGGKGGQYFVLGQLRMEDMRDEAERQYAAMRAHQLLAAAKAQQEQGGAQAEEQPAADGAADAAPAAAPEVEEEVDMTGINEEDLKLAMEQTRKSKKVCVETLRKVNGDVVEAIMKLTN